MWVKWIIWCITTTKTIYHSQLQNILFPTTISFYYLHNFFIFHQLFFLQPQHTKSGVRAILGLLFDVDKIFNYIYIKKKNYNSILYYFSWNTIEKKIQESDGIHS